MADPRTHVLPAPGLLWGAYPERNHARAQGLAGLAAEVAARVSLPNALLEMRYRHFARHVQVHSQHWSKASHEARTSRLQSLQSRLARDGLQTRSMEELFALVSLMCHHTMGLAPFDTQLMAARAMLDNYAVEMATGEGKTLAVAMAAAVGAMAGIPIHVITANDYLVERDAERLGQFYAHLGLSVGRVTSQHDSVARQAAYGRDITYCTAKELGFDYLRDRVTARKRGGELHQRAERLADGADRRTLLRGLCMAIVDEADSILIDEARVPLILARRLENQREAADHAQALELARQLVQRQDFELDRESCLARLTEAGTARLISLAESMPGTWQNRRHREEWVRLALAALHLFMCDRDYILHDGRVEIVDPTTGRVARGRSWSRGLHQLIELKEGCEPTPVNVTTAQITFQRLFRRYHRLTGVSGTLRESRPELARVYGLQVFRLPLRLPSQRQVMPKQVFPDKYTLWATVADRVASQRPAGRPVLIGTDSVADSEALAAALASAGLTCRVLNARQDKAEADIVALAGMRGQVTVTTNMAGRGTDIPLGASVLDLGGLHVISCQHNGSRRIDRQLLGRCARQGQPGSVERMLSLESHLLHKCFPESWMEFLYTRLGTKHGQWLTLILATLAQRLEEGREASARRRLLQDDERLARQFAISGPLE